MKKTTWLLSVVFVVAYATFLSLGVECLFWFYGLSFNVSVDSVLRYPRLFPFCICAGLFALLAMGILFMFHVKASEKYGFTKDVWGFQLFVAFVLSIPMIKPWEMLFDFLHKTF